MAAFGALGNLPVSVGEGLTDIFQIGTWASLPIVEVAGKVRCVDRAVPGICVMPICAIIDGVGQGDQGNRCLRKLGKLLANNSVMGENSSQDLEESRRLVSKRWCQKTCWTVSVAT